MRDFVVGNILEYNLRTLGDSASAFELAAWDAPGTDLADLAVFWGGDDTTVLVPQPLEPAWIADVVSTLHLQRLRVLTASGRTRSVCADTISDRGLFDLICGELNGVRISAWGPTPQLRALLQTTACGQSSTVGLPDVDLFWLAWNLDSKAGFRHFIQQANIGGSVAMPPGFIVPDAETALDAIAYFLARDRECVLKTAHGTAGFGILKVPPAKTVAERDRAFRELRSRMRFDSGWVGRPIVIEEWITGPEGQNAIPITADFEIQSDGSVSFLGGGRMIMRKSQYYSGVLCGRGALDVETTEKMIHAGNAVGRAAGRYGLRGLFDLDFVVSSDGSLWITEMNASSPW